MKVYADTSFLVRLATHEAGSEQAMAEGLEVTVTPS